MKSEPETNTLDEKVQTTLPQDSKVKTESVENQKVNVKNQKVNVKTESENVEVTKDKSKTKLKRKIKCWTLGWKEEDYSWRSKRGWRRWKEEEDKNSPEGSSANQEPKDSKTEFKEINPMGHKNGTPPKPKQPSTPFQEKELEHLRMSDALWRYVHLVQSQSLSFHMCCLTTMATRRRLCSFSTLERKMSFLLQKDIQPSAFFWPCDMPQRWVEVPMQPLRLQGEVPNTYGA